MNDEYDQGSYGWDAEIEDDGAEFEPLPEGEYEFTVVDFERKRNEGRGKIPPCLQAALTLKIVAPDGRESRAFENLYLHKKFEWKTSAFFRSIGQKKHGEKLRPNWDRVVGSTGRAIFEVHEYNDKKSNQVKKYIDASEVSYTAPTATISASNANQNFEEADDLPF